MGVNRLWPIELYARVSEQRRSPWRTGQMPFVILNAFGVLKYKGMGEQALMDSGLPFTILRPGRLTDGSAVHSHNTCFCSN